MMNESARMKILGFGVFIALVLCAPRFAAPQDSRWLDFEPAVVTLRGKVTTIVKYGPPGYGESPEIDALEIPIVLVLPLPVRVAEAVTNLTHIQLVFDTNRFPNYRTYIGKQVVIKGKLFEAVTGHHHTPVLLEVVAVDVVSAANSAPQRSEKRYLAELEKPGKKGVPRGWVPRAPEIAQLEGDLSQIVKYGAPNYGDPRSDKKLDVPLLMLLAPATVDGVQDNVGYVQLIFPKDIRYQRYLDRTVRVTGTLSAASAREHFAAVVMEVRTIQPVAAKK
jgi:Domain of unknown function (DUF4431)